MNNPDVPRSWQDHIDAIDKRLAEKGAPSQVRNGIIRDVEEHLHQMTADRPDIPKDVIPRLLDPPEAYAEAFEEATSAVPERESGKRPVRLRECRSRHGEDGKRRIHICGSCFRVFHGCLEYETHICDSDFHWNGQHIPYWSHRKRWTIAIIIAVLLFLPIHWLLYGWLTADPCSGNRRRYHDYSNISYMRNLALAIATFQTREKREPENLQELVESKIWYGNWIMPGDLKDLGGEGGFAAERLYYIHAAGMNMSMTKNRQPWLVLTSHPRDSNAICYTVAYTNADVVHYATLGEFLTDWETKQ